MIDTRVVKNSSGTKDLCETYSDTYQIKKVGTDEVYAGGSAVDLIAGFYPTGKPYCRYAYVETDKPIEQEEVEE